MVDLSWQQDGFQLTAMRPTGKVHFIMLVAVGATIKLSHEELSAQVDMAPTSSRWRDVATS